MEAAKAIAAIVAFSAIISALIFVVYETSPTSPCRSTRRQAMTDTVICSLCGYTNTIGMTCRNKLCAAPMGCGYWPSPTGTQLTEADVRRILREELDARKTP